MKTRPCLTESSSFNPSTLSLSLSLYSINFTLIFNAGILIDSFIHHSDDPRSRRIMGSLFPSQLSLNCRFSPKPCVQKTIGGFLAEVSRLRTAPEKISKLEDYVNRLEDEMKKIDAFKRELPLCMLLLGDGGYLPFRFPFGFEFFF